MPVTASKLKLTGNGAAYHRVSIATDAKDLDRQRESTATFQQVHQVTIRPAYIFEDRDWKRDEADIRPAFQKMIQLAEQGQIQWIVIDQQNRFGTKDVKQRLKYLIRLDDAGCRLFTAEGKQLHVTDLLGLIETGIDAKASSEELLSKAQGVIGGKCKRAETGEWMGGHIPYGMAVVCLDQNRKEKWRVEIEGRNARVKINANGKRERYDGNGNFPACDELDRLEIRPSIFDERLEHVRDAFKAINSEAVGVSAIARRFNIAGVKTQYGSFWRSGHVVNLLTNPIYIGRQPYNRNSSAKYSEMAHNGDKLERRQVSEDDFGKYRKRDRADWILSTPLFAPVVDPDLFKQTQKRLTEQAKKKLPRSPQMWLSGLMFCAHCGQPLTANVRRKKDKKTKRIKAIYYEYVCATYTTSHVKSDEVKPNSCPRYMVKHEQAEQYVRRYLEDCGAQMQLENREGHPLRLDMSEYFKATAEMRRRVGDDDHCLDDVATPYRRIFEQEAPELQRQLDALNTEHTTIVNGLMRLPDTATLAIKKGQKQLTELETKIADLRKQLDNAADVAADAFAEIQRQVMAWEEAKATINEDVSGRQKRDAVEKVIRSMVWTFKHNAGRKRGEHEPESVQISPQDAQYKSVTWLMH